MPNDFFKTFQNIKTWKTEIWFETIKHLLQYLFVRKCAFLHFNLTKSNTAIRGERHGLDVSLCYFVENNKSDVKTYLLLFCRAAIILTSKASIRKFLMRY